MTVSLGDEGKVNVLPRSNVTRVQVRSSTNVNNVQVRSVNWSELARQVDENTRELTDHENRIEYLEVTVEEIKEALNTYIHEQGIASSEWTINHNLNKFPSVTIVDSAGNEIIADVKYVDSNTCIINFTSPFKGNAYLN